MADLTLTRFDSDDLELFVDESTGRAYASIRATARMLGRDESVVRRWLTAALIETFSAEVPTATGLKTAALLTPEQIFEAALKYSPELAKKMGAAGANTFLLGTAGYSVKIEPVVPLTRLELAKEQLRLIEEIELQAEQIKLLEEDNLRQSEVIDELFDYSSIIRIAKYNNCSETKFSWHKLKAASKKLDLEIKKVPCPRFTVKNLYGHDAWRLAYPGVNLPETTTLVISG